MPDFVTMDQHFDYEKVRIELDSLIATRTVNVLPPLKDSVNDLCRLGSLEVCNTATNEFIVDKFSIVLMVIYDGSY